MRKRLSRLELATLVAASFLLPLSCGEDTCRIEIDSADSGDPIAVRVCATCNEGKDPQGAETVELEFIPNAVDVGCRCAGASCVFCTTEDCPDEACARELVTDEPTGCTAPSISLELADEEFEGGTRVPVTIRAVSRLGETTRVVHLTRATPTPTATITPPPTPTTTPTPTPTPTSSLPL